LDPEFTLTSLDQSKRAIENAVSDACKHLSLVIDAQLQAKAKMFVAKHKDAEQQLNDANSADFEQLRQLKREV
jgi:hypothetical protein